MTPQVAEPGGFSGNSICSDRMCASRPSFSAELQTASRNPKPIGPALLPDERRQAAPEALIQYRFSPPTVYGCAQKT